VKALRIFAFAAVAFSSTAYAAPDDAPPKIELPLGPYVRPGRPLDVRVIGGADRVRAPGTPWALPQGERGDEFILQLTEATVGVLSLEIDRGGRVERTSMTVETLPVDKRVVGVRGDDAASPGALALRLPDSGLPTVREGWLLLDDVSGHVVPNAVEDSLRAIRDARAAARPFEEPLLFPPDPAAFVTMSRVAASAPMLPGDVGVLLALLAGVEVALVVVLRSRDVSRWRRAAWLAMPSLVATAFIFAGGRLPGALSATAGGLYGRFPLFVVVRVEARRDGHARFVLPDVASSAAMIRFSADDATVADASVGREVVLDLRAGESRLFAYSMRSNRESGVMQELSMYWSNPGSPVPEALRSWIEGHGFDAEGIDNPFTWMSLPRAVGTVVVPGAHALAATPRDAK
jgi:hypothetical protein